MNDERRPQIHLIVAMTAQRTIGFRGGLPWSLPDDLRLFRRLTLGQTVIGGRATFAAIGHPLDGRLNLVVSRNADRVAGLVPCRSLDDALAQAQTAGREIFCIGGAELYRQMLPLADWLHISWVDQEVAGDTCFPAFSLEDWEEIASADHPGFRHATYRRRNDGD